ncbi:fic family toxin-antitoxin system, toxin component [Streptomyces sp. HF10]|uniref:fic family toxin-antitoxin system, toxin component n=1 Tax=Streptomyces sp. HF10 TaxID=2692233 RepID=UPI0019166D4A|nr:fic family toxin-antitoxin system, toxin component [Streptomyces sp. HF10]
MILRVDRARLLEVAHHCLRTDPDVTDGGSLAAAVACHADEVMDSPVYPEPHHRAATLMHQLVRVPALEAGNELFGAVVAAVYLTASGLTIVAVEGVRRLGRARPRRPRHPRDLAHEIRRE